jgi:ADP-ribosylglycohydrolase
VDVFELFSNNVGSFSFNVSRRGSLFSVNLGRKWPMFSSQGIYVFEPLQLGMPLEFKAPGTFKAITDMIGGGPFDLEPGQWTDDTSMALCLAESLIEKRSFDPKDQMDRYCRWRDQGI